MNNGGLGNQYSRSSNNNPCPICGDRKGKCQTNYDEDFVLCMDTHTAVNGWHFIGVNKSGVWGMHSLTSVVMSEQERLNKRIEKEKSERLKKEYFKTKSLTVADRDKAIRLIHKTIGLSRNDRKGLIKRGLNESQIDLGLFFSVNGYTQIPDTIPVNLAGVYLDNKGNKNLYAKNHFACPAFDYQGNAIGWQYRNNESIGAKYKWALTEVKDKSDKVIKKIQSHLPNTELPITFVSGDRVSEVKPPTEIINQWLINVDSDLQESKVIFATEGFLKPFIASCKFGVDTIGAVGFNFSSGIEQVTEIISRGGYNCVILPLDGGAVTNAMIMSQLAKNVKIFEDLGCKVFIGWWSQFNKTDNDFDEINSLEQVRLIDYGTVKTMSNSAIYRQWKNEELGKLKGFKSDKTIDKKRFYDDGAIADSEIDSILDNNQSIIIRGSKASGKSYMIKQLIKRWQSSGGNVINIGCRRVLCESQSNEWGITYIVDAENERYTLQTILDRDGGLSIVIDSLQKLKNIDWSNTLIILDEFEQFVSHTLTANTQVKDYRGYILQTLEDKFKLSLATGGKIIGLDADCSDISSDWLEGVTGVKPFKLDNIAKSHNNNCYVFSGDKEGYNDLIQSIFNDLGNDEKIFIASDSRKDLEAIQIEVLKAFPNLPCEIVTSDTVAEAYIRDFIKSPNKAIQETQVLMLGASPVMQSGVSIDIKGYFSKVYGICTGIIEPMVMRQLLIRVRDNCDRYLWIADKARGIYSNDFDYQKILSNKDTFINSLPEIAQYVTALNENLTNVELLDKIKLLLDKQNNLADINSVTKAKLTARRNLALSNYRAVLIEELRNEGYRVYDNYESQTTSVVFGGVDLSETKKEIDRSKAIAVNNADDITSIENERLKNKTYQTKEEQYKLLKYSIKDNFPLVLLNPLFILNYIIKDNWQFLKSVKRFYFAQNKEVAQELDRKAIHYQHRVALSGGKLWLEDIKPNSSYTALFERLGLSELMNDELTISKHSEQLKAFFERCKDYKKIDGISNRELLRSCGIKFSNNVELVNLLRKVVKLFGHKLECVERRELKSKTIRHYRIIRGCDGELWRQLINSFEFKYQKIEPINYDFDLENNYDYQDDFEENNCFDEENAVTYTSNELECLSLPTNFVKENNHSDRVLNQDTVSNSGVLTEKVIFEPKLSLNNQELVGKKCNFWNNKNQWVTGFIAESLDFGLKIKDTQGNVSYCALSQIEVINEALSFT